MKTTNTIDRGWELLTKYSTSGPRYTSYPTVPHFQQDFSHQQLDQAISHGNNCHQPLSLYFHIPFCHKLCYYCGCNMMVTKNQNKVATYMDYLTKELTMVAEKVNREREVVQIHFGGGTPTYLTPEQLENFVNKVFDLFHVTKDAEIGIEVDPRTMNSGYLKNIREMGFNRLSFGVQDFDPQVQAAVNRIQPEEMVRSIVEQSRKYNFDSINLDLIYGLPHQTLESYERTMEQVIALDADRLAVFHYAHVPWIKKHQSVIPESALPSSEEKYAMMKMIIAKLKGAGYHYIGQDHFAKGNDDLSKAFHNGTLHRNFQGYTTMDHLEVYAMGVSAISQLDMAYAQNVKTIPEYQALLDQDKLPILAGHEMTKDDYIRRHVIMELMCNHQIVISDVEEKFDIDFVSYFADAQNSWYNFAKDDLVIMKEDLWQITELGRILVRNLVMPFDAYLSPQNSEKVMYSRTV